MTDPGRWIAEKLEELSEVTGAAILMPGLIEVSRARLPLVRLAYLDEPIVDADLIQTAFRQWNPFSFILNLPSSGVIRLDAKREAMRLGFGIGKFGDARRALSLRDPSDYLSADMTFVERILRQDRRIAMFERVDVQKYRLSLDSGESITIIVSFDYEVTADAVRTAVDAYGTFEAFVTANPNAQAISPQALSVGAGGDFRIFRWTEFLAAVGQSWK